MFVFSTALDSSFHLGAAIISSGWISDRFQVMAIPDERFQARLVHLLSEVNDEVRLLVNTVQHTLIAL